MATVPTDIPVVNNGYPTTDHRPMAETDWHRDLMLTLIETLKWQFAGFSRIYVSGNLLVFYEPGNRRRHVSPDVFVVRGVANVQRPNYLIWEEGRAPQVVMELTSSTTRKEDVRTKFHLYQDKLKVREYFLFDPLGDYLKPQLQGYRLRQQVYQPIRPTPEGRLPSQVLGLHLEPLGRELRLVDPTTGQRLPTPQERAAEAEAEVKRLVRENAELRQKLRPRR